MIDISEESSEDMFLMLTSHNVRIKTLTIYKRKEMTIFSQFSLPPTSFSSKNMLKMSITDEEKLLDSSLLRTISLFLTSPPPRGGYEKHTSTWQIP